VHGLTLSTSQGVVAARHFTKTISYLNTLSCGGGGGVTGDCYREFVILYIGVIRRLYDNFTWLQQFTHLTPSGYRISHCCLDLAVFSSLSFCHILSSVGQFSAWDMLWSNLVEAFPFCFSDVTARFLYPLPRRRLEQFLCCRDYWELCYQETEVLLLTALHGSLSNSSHY
jgi:hypothetical protein